MVNIIKAESFESFSLVETLAYSIWTEHYTPIIGKAQVDYMLAKFQSKSAIEQQVINGYEYFILYFFTEPVGYVSFKQEDASTLFLSKIYVKSAYRGKKIGKEAMRFVEAKAKTYNLNKIRLTVNIHNSNAIATYQKLGFKSLGALVADIGNGYVMDDYEMVKKIKLFN
ncbi:GNAT family N-acetyltransferase [Seonamhaeicola marinus]|uniref:GNAT family N-acetyltransferase n=1 Tax=Seonamhaeicola marinus TaxID=1912246 RepID=A0A5D0HKZ9_9FLAO|nr:GNAT family N-acetyltransferase [Seonamhaeicola marinus]TYA71650.1 GNAT family N-acetyltransferase [Seonamhaeicola marinus]